MKPIVCTLSSGEFESREAEWRAALERGMNDCRETPRGFELSIARDEQVLTEINRLAALESSCCTWLDITVTDTDPIVLTMTSQTPGGKDVIRMLIKDVFAPLPASAPRPCHAESAEGSAAGPRLPSRCDAF